MNLSDISFDISSLNLEQIPKVLTLFENEGVKGAWLTENSFRDAFVELGAFSNRTKRIRFGTMVASIFARSPMMTALAAVSLSNLSNGRFVLGLGTQTKNFVDYWYGKKFENPLAQMAEFAEICHKLLEGSVVSVKGKYFSVKNLQLPVPAHPVKIFIAAIGPKMIRLAGKLADGVMGTFWTEKYIRETVVPNLKIGAEKAGRSLDNFEILCSKDCFLTDDIVTYEAVKPLLISHAMVPLFKPVFGGMEYSQEYSSINQAMAAGDVKSALSVITPEMVSDLELVGTGSQLRKKVEDLRKAGLTEVVLNPYLGNVYYEHYPDQFSFDITRFNQSPVYNLPDLYPVLISNFQ